MSSKVTVYAGQKNGPAVTHLAAEFGNIEETATRLIVEEPRLGLVSLGRRARTDLFSAFFRSSRAANNDGDN